MQYTHGTMEKHKLTSDEPSNPAIPRVILIGPKLVVKTSAKKGTKIVNFKPLEWPIFQMKRDQQRLEVHFSSIHHCISSCKSLPAPHLQALIHPITTSEAYHLVQYSHSFTDNINLFVNRLLGITCWISKNDAQYTTHMTLRWFLSHAEWCLTPPGTSDPNRSIASVWVHKLLGHYWDTHTLAGRPKTSNIVCFVCIILYELYGGTWC
jgi:hypothetical protein